MRVFFLLLLVMASAASTGCGIVRIAEVTHLEHESLLLPPAATIEKRDRSYVALSYYVEVEMRVEGEIPDVIQFYREGMRKRGWRTNDPPDDDAIYFQRGDQEAFVFLTQREDHIDIRISLSAEHFWDDASILAQLVWAYGFQWVPDGMVVKEILYLF